MSLATLNVWVTAIGDPCHIDNDPTRKVVVHIVDCEGNVLTWCGRTYRDIPTECGHATIEIPPGCYAVFASEGVGIGTFGNVLTHVQIVRANCGDHVCVTLFTPSAHLCGTWFGAAVGLYLAEMTKAVGDPRLVTGALEAVQKLVAKLPADTFSSNLRKLLPKADEDRG
jgi:hypothetical protein